MINVKNFSAWISQRNLRRCSLAARGLWAEMICYAADATPTGFVLGASTPLSTTDLAQMCGAPEAVVESAFAELLDAGVAARDRKGRVFIPRLVEFAKKAQTARKNGVFGGNPTLCKKTEISASDKGMDKGWVKPGVNPEKQIPPLLSPHTPHITLPFPPDDCSLRSQSSRPRWLVDQMVDIWREECCPTLAEPQRFSPDRVRRTAARLHDSFGDDFDHWRRFCQRIRGSPFLCGERTSWRASFDWALQPKHITKIEEGDYDDRPNGPADGQRKSRSAESFESFMRTTADLATGRREGADCSRNGHAEGDLLV